MGLSLLPLLDMSFDYILSPDSQISGSDFILSAKYVFAE